MKLKATFTADIVPLANSTGFQCRNMEKIVYESVKEVFSQIKWEDPPPKALVKKVEKARKKYEFSGFNILANAFNSARVSEPKI